MKNGSSQGPSFIKNKFIFPRVNLNVTTSHTITAGSECSNSNVLEDQIHLYVWNFDRISFIVYTKLLHLGTDPSCDIIKNHSIKYGNKSKSLKCKNMGQDLNELQAAGLSSIWCTCDKSRSCTSGATFQRREGKCSVRPAVEELWEKK